MASSSSTNVNNAANSETKLPTSSQPENLPEQTENSKQKQGIFQWFRYWLFNNYSWLFSGPENKAHKLEKK